MTNCMLRFIAMNALKQFVNHAVARNQLDSAGAGAGAGLEPSRIVPLLVVIELNMVVILLDISG